MCLSIFVTLVSYIEYSHENYAYKMRLKLDDEKLKIWLKCGSSLLITDTIVIKYNCAQHEMWYSQESDSVITTHIYTSHITLSAMRLIHTTYKLDSNPYVSLLLHTT